ncbi:hypothetical protein ACFPH6_12120 [Streptomyces xiangluensis]|uniref:Uncharacterized protein n=1 Tax=Streptomyces xiangluensis TaxID=2665720 RepID=A0ABV8YLU5_9ACTN
MRQRLCAAALAAASALITVIAAATTAAADTAAKETKVNRQSLCVDLAFEGAFDEKEAFADATVYIPNLSPDIHERMPFTKERARELGERFSLTSWYGAGERGPGEQ